MLSMRAIWGKKRAMVRILSLLACAISLAVTGQSATWRIETIDATEVGLSSSMKIDREGNVHLCYVGGHGRVLKYAYWDHSTSRWFTMEIDERPNACSLTLDSK